MFREVLMAFYLGAGLVADAFIVAQRLPNMFRNLVAEGAFNASFVPSFSQLLHQQGKEQAKLFAERLQTLMVTGLFLFISVLQIGMPWLIGIIAPGYADTPEKINLSSQLSQITLPYLIFMFLTALQSGILYSLNQFAVATLAPILLNICLIFALYFLVPGSSQPGLVLAWTLFVSGVLQFLMTGFFCYRAEFSLYFVYPRFTPEIKAFFKKMLPGFVGAGVTQINLLVGTIIATWQDSAVSYLYYADRVYQLPLALLGTAAGTALLPMLSQALAKQDKNRANNLQEQGLFLSLMLGIPATIALVIIPYPIVNLLFERGQFTHADALETSLALQILSVGLPAYLWVKSFLPCFYARHNTKTPFHIALVCVAINMVLNLALFPWIGFIGIAVATVAASFANGIMLYLQAKKWGYFELSKKLKKNIGKMCLSGGLMGVMIALFAGYVVWPVSLWGRFLYLSVIIISAALVYFACLFLMGVISWSRRTIR